MRFQPLSTKYRGQAKSFTESITKLLKRAKYGMNSNMNRRLSGLSSMRLAQGPGTERKG